MRPSVLTVLMCLSAGTAHAQVTAYANAGFGLGTVRTVHPVPTGTGQQDEYAVSGVGVVAGARIGVALKPVSLQAAGRSTFGLGTPHRAITVGPAVHWGRRTRVVLRGGFGWLQVFEPVACFSNPPLCPRYHSSWVATLDLSAAVIARSRQRRVGGEVWWSQSRRDVPRTTAIGAGLFVEWP